MATWWSNVRGSDMHDGSATESIVETTSVLNNSESFAASALSITALGATVGQAQEAVSHHLYEVPVVTQHIVVGQQNHRFDPGLRHQEPVEGILMNSWQFNYFCGVLTYCRQVMEAGRFDAGQHLSRIGLELAEGTLETDLPNRRGARKYFARIDPLPRLLRELGGRAKRPKQQVSVEQQPHA
jgi:hypothetical protein